MILYSALHGCRSCFCPREEWGNLEYPSREHGRFHWDTVLDRRQAHRLRGAEKNRYFAKRGMRPEESPYVDLCPSLDLIRSRPLDAPHSEWRGLGRILQALLIQEILTKAGASAYLQAFQKFPFRHNWPRIQSPLYIWSWSLSEAGRATLLTPLILRCKSRTA